MNEGRKHQRRGAETEAKVISRLVRYGFGISTPAFGTERYDLILDREGYLERIQVKTAYDHWKRDQTVVVEFDTTVYGSDGKPSKTYYSSEEIDSYLVYCPGRDALLYVPFEETPQTQMNFSFAEPSEFNEGNQQDMNFARDYLVSKRFPELKSGQSSG